MIELKSARDILVGLIQKYMQIPVIRLNQNAKPPDYPYIGYTITTLMKTNNGTYSEEVEDGVKTYRKDFTSTWSFSTYSNDDLQSKEIALKLYDYLDNVGVVEMSDNGVFIQRISDITNRDNLLTTEYEYRNGFDATLAFANVITEEDEETIDDIALDYAMK